MPYLTNPNQSSIRQYNYTQGGLNVQKDGTHNGPCVFDGFNGGPRTCSQTPVSKSVCEDNGGTWWGEGATSNKTYGGGLAECWQVNQLIWEHEGSHYASQKVDQTPQQGFAVRNDHYKLVKNQWQDYDVKTNEPVPVSSIEFYRVNEKKTFPLIDLEALDLLQKPLNPVEQLNFNILQARMKEVTSSAPLCPGDGNGDDVVDERDVEDYNQIATRWGLSSHYDFNIDGFTDGQDLGIILNSFGPCPRPNH